ncbi:MAG: hypothetical protein KAU62_09670 [Candidatus Heimdallarchaeota archaeon]|nr:hypothetical protein [Candidatus Heimdallarchaeota archaeon]MCK4611409.1 hypothetical protein [Candidatus Heimdallarchaeota archaeon]
MKKLSSNAKPKKSIKIEYEKEEDRIERLEKKVDEINKKLDVLLPRK